MNQSSFRRAFVKRFLILPTPFRLGETSAAALAAIGLAVDDLWALRTGRRQEVAVDTRQATASLRSGHYVSTERNTVMGVYPAKHGRWRRLPSRTCRRARPSVPLGYHEPVWPARAT